MTDEEIICAFMEAKPEKQPWDYVLGEKYTDWWTNTMDGYKVALSVCGRREALGRLHEVEERLTDQQRLMYWLELSTGGPPELGYWRLIHASAAQKIKALAAVLRRGAE